MTLLKLQNTFLCICYFLVSSSTTTTQVADCNFCNPLCCLQKILVLVICSASCLAWKWRPRNGKKVRRDFCHCVRWVRHPSSTLYWNIKGEADLHRHIVKSTEVSGGTRGRARGSRKLWGIDRQSKGGKGPDAKIEVCVGDWKAVAGKVIVQQTIIVSKPLVREAGEQDKWKEILLTQGWGKECWEHMCWERLRTQERMLKTPANYKGPKHGQ